MCHYAGWLEYHGYQFHHHPRRRLVGASPSSDRAEQEHEQPECKAVTAKFHAPSLPPVDRGHGVGAMLARV